MKNKKMMMKMNVSRKSVQVLKFLQKKKDRLIEILSQYLENTEEPPMFMHMYLTANQTIDAC